MPFRKINMDDLIKLSLLDEVDTQSLLALSSFIKIQELINYEETKQLKDVWKYLQAFLAHSSILGSLIFKKGNPDKTKVVTDYLKTELKIKDNSPIREKGGRNFLEHIEVFEIYASNRNDTKGILQMVFNDRKGFEYFDLKKWYIKRVLIMDEMIFIYQNQEAKKELLLMPIFDEVKRIFSESENAKNRLPIIQY
jgi:hypothetical protein